MTISKISSPHAAIDDAVLKQAADAASPALTGAETVQYDPRDYRYAPYAEDPYLARRDYRALDQQKAIDRSNRSSLKGFPCIEVQTPTGLTLQLAGSEACGPARITGGNGR